jgi:hypothetical protein
MSSDNAEQIYNVLKETLDEESFILFHTAQDILHCDVYRHFIVEDTLGWFEEADGNKLKTFAEIACFGKCEYEIAGPYEILKSYEIDCISPKYVAYQKELWPKAVENVLKGRLYSEQLPQTLRQLLALKDGC